MYSGLKFVLSFIAIGLVAQSNAQVYRELICRNVTGDFSLRCPDRRAVQVIGYETQHTQLNSPQQCDAGIISEDVYSVSQTAGTIQQDCTYRNGDRSNCILTSSAIQRYFVSKELTDSYWEKVPKRILVKYTCSIESGVERMDVTLWTGIGMIALAIGCQTK